MWFNEIVGNQIVRMTLSGEFTNSYPFPSPNSYAGQILVGPDNNLWVTENHSNKIGRLNPTTGVLTEWVMPTSGSTPSGMTNAADGALWFTEWGESISRIARITTSGVLTEYPDGTANSGPWGIVPGPNGTDIWYTEFYTSMLGMMPVCAVGLTASYSSGTLDFGFSVGSTAPYTWTTGAYQNGVLLKQLWSDALPAEMPLKTFSGRIAFPSTVGDVTFVSGLYTSSGSPVCTENVTIDNAVKSK
jgi:hypothetical protein